LEVTAEEAYSLASCYGENSVYNVDRNEFMNANANQVVQTLSDEQLKKCDFMLLLDHSGSMGESSIRRQGRTKWEELEEDVSAIAREAQNYDADGLTVIAFSSGVRVFDGVTADKVSQTFKEVVPRGSTNLGDALQAAIAKVEASTKDTIILCFTDGAPDSDSSVIEVINSAGNKFGRPRIGITFVQVGEAPGATAFLQQLNSSLKVDVVAVASAKEAEGLTLGQLAWMAQNS
jgi:uncharacterized protein YegL